MHVLWRVRVRVMVFNVTFNNISAISPAVSLLVEETGVKPFRIYEEDILIIVINLLLKIYPNLPFFIGIVLILNKICVPIFKFYSFKRVSIHSK